jgi:DNA-binding transcriptional regulator YiaG
MATPEKRCPMCNRIKPRSEFYFTTYVDRRRNRMASRWSSYCRECESAYQRQALAHKYRTDPRFREQVKQRVRRYRAAQRKEAREYRAWKKHAARQALDVLRAAKIPVRQIAAACGVSDDAVRKWDRGINTPRDETLRRLRRMAEELRERPHRSRDDSALSPGRLGPG